MARRQLLTYEERTALLGIPADPDSLARLFTPSRADQALVAERRCDANRLGYAVQLALLRHPGTALAYLDQPADALVTWMAGHLDIPADAFVEYGRRPQTMTDHARQIADTLGLRAPTMADLPPMVEAAAEAARGTDSGRPIAAAVIAALRAGRVILPGSGVIERVAIAGRARARKRAAAALVAGLPVEHLTRLDGLLVIDPSVGMTRFAWLKAMPVAPKADHVRELLDRLRLVRGLGLPAENADRIHADRPQQFVREGFASDAHQLGRYADHRRHAILAATVLDLEARLTDAVLDMADKLIGSLFAKARNTARRRYAASASDVGRLMRLFHGTIEALVTAQESDADAFEAVDDAVGWPKLLRARDQVRDLAALAGEDPLVHAVDRWKTLRKFAPALIEALQFRAIRPGDPMLAALRLLADLNRSGKRDVPADAPMPFRKDWRRLVMEGGGRTDACMRRPYSRRCATGCARVTSGSSAPPAIAGSTATCCRRTPCQQWRPDCSCPQPRTNGWPPEAPSWIGDCDASPAGYCAGNWRGSNCATAACTSLRSRRPPRRKPAPLPTGSRP